MHDELIALVPEFNLIDDEDLRGQTLTAFTDALTTGGWKPGDLTRMPFTILVDPSPATMLEHIRAVTRIALAIAKALDESYPNNPRMKVNTDFLIASALLHDAGKLIEFEEKDGRFGLSRSGRLLGHSVGGMAIARGAGLPEEVQHAIAYHSHEGDKFRATVEAIIVNHAHFVIAESMRL